MKTLLIDADYTVFSVAAANQVKLVWEDDIVTTHIDLGAAKNVLSSIIHDTAAAASDNPDDPSDVEVILCFSCPTRRYFRHDIEPSYKGNRKGSATPLGLRELREWANATYTCRTKPNLEADDVLGIMATDKRIVKGEVVICSVDKDLDQIPGLHLNPNALEDGIYVVSSAMGHRQFLMQCLTGDATDGYPGCPGIGPVKAERIVDAIPEGANWWPYIVAPYMKAGQSESDALRQARLARILQAHDYDHTSKEPIPWTPSAS